MYLTKNRADHLLELRSYLSLTRSDAQRQWQEILRRETMPIGKRQVDFSPIETLLCFGLGLVGTRSKSGTINIRESADTVIKVSTLVKRTPASLAAKLANLDGRRPNSAKHERALWAALTHDLLHFGALYETVMDASRAVGIGEEMLPDFLGLQALSMDSVIGADRVSSEDLREAVDQDLRKWRKNHPKEDSYLTERAMIGTARIGQQQFARAVLLNGCYACVFCGLNFKSAGLPSARMLIASHIKPWRECLDVERVDPENGLSACPTHDAAFDSFLMTVMPNLKIELTTQLETAIRQNPIVARNFGPSGMNGTIVLSRTAPRPAANYLAWHHAETFRTMSENSTTPLELNR